MSRARNGLSRARKALSRLRCDLADLSPVRLLERAPGAPDEANVDALVADLRDGFAHRSARPHPRRSDGQQDDQ